MKVKPRDVWFLCWVGLFVGLCQLGFAVYSYRQTTVLFDNLDKTLTVFLSRDVAFEFVKVMPKSEGNLFASMLQHDVANASRIREMARSVQWLRYRDAKADMKFGAGVAVLFGLIMWGLRKSGFSSPTTSQSVKSG